MTCDDARARLSAHLDGDLPEGEATALELHLAACAPCQAVRDEWAAMVGGLRELPTIEPHPHRSAALWARIDGALDDEGARPSRLRAAIASIFGGRRRLWLAAPALALVAAVGGAVALRAHRAPAGTISDEALLADAQAEFSKAESHYLRAAGDLRAVAERERARWPDDRRRRFDDALAAIDGAVEKWRGAAHAHPGDPEAQELLYDAYRKQIAFLEEAILRSAVSEVAP